MALRVVRRGACCALRGVRARGCEARDVPACPPCARSRGCEARDVPACPQCARARGCGARDVPACPPCVRAPQPECRARPPAVRHAQRVVCCAPPQGSRPPCAPREPACSLTCEHSRAKDSKSSCRQEQVEASSSYAIKPCDCEQDPVAQRIMMAKKTRQAQYEREVASRQRASRAAPAPPAAGFSLGAERECARATDGCTYAMRAAPAPRTRCGPGRTPPPPRYVELAPDDGCRIRGDAHLDPCAHCPRVMIEIDRGANTETCRTHPATPPSKTSSGPRSSPGPSGRHPNWCTNPPQPAPAPPRCRRPTIVERLRARSDPFLPKPRDERRLHTSAAFCKTSKPFTSNSSGLEAMLQKKESLKEAGVGRFVKDDCGRPARGLKAPAGKLELRVPPGTKRVAVQVSLDGAPVSSSAGGSLPTIATASTCAERTSNSCDCSVTCDKQNSWLSIKSIQKKLSGCHSDDESSGARAAAGRCGAGLRRPAAEPRCGPAAAAAGSGAPRGPRRCSSTSAYLANTIIVNAF